MDTVITFATVGRDGVYVCGTCEDAEDVLRKGEEAPRCGNCNRPVTWLFRRPLGLSRQIGFRIER